MLAAVQAGKDLGGADVDEGASRECEQQRERPGLEARGDRAARQGSDGRGERDHGERRAAQAGRAPVIMVEIVKPSASL